MISVDTITRYAVALPNSVPKVDLEKGANNIVNTILLFAGIVAVVMIIVAGISYITAYGEPSKTLKAKHTIVGAVAGLMVVMLAFTLVAFVIPLVSGNNMKRYLASLLLIATMSVGTVFLAAQTTVAATDYLFTNPACDSNSSDICDKADKQKLLPTIARIINVVMLVTGILAVVFIIEGGRRFITGSGNPEKVKQARHIIIYACVGLLVSILAFTIVNFVVLATN